MDKNNSKWIIGQNITTRSIELLEYLEVLFFCELGLGKSLLNISPKAQVRKKLVNLDFIKIRKLCTSKFTLRIIKTQDGIKKKA